MIRKKEPAEVLWEIKNEMPNFDKEELLEYAKWAILNLHKSLINQEATKVKCEKETVNKLVQEKSKYRITNEIDHITIQYAELFDCIKENDKVCVQVYMSIYFYDDADNDIRTKSADDKYWNDIWIVTFKQDIEEGQRNSNCSNCNAIMKYNKFKDVFECEYCGNIMDNKQKSNWKISNIEIG